MTSYLGESFNHPKVRYLCSVYHKGISITAKGIDRSKEMVLMRFLFYVPLWVFTKKRFMLRVTLLLFLVYFQSCLSL